MTRAATTALSALASGRWDEAHRIVQGAEGDPGCDWIHAHLHRREGDAANARYWYRRAGRDVATVPFDEELAAIAVELRAAS